MSEKAPLIVFIVNNQHLKLAKYHEQRLSNFGLRVAILSEDECLSVVTGQTLVNVESLSSSARIPKFIYAKAFIPHIFPDEEQIVYLDVDLSVDYETFVTDLPSLRKYRELPIYMVEHVGVPKKIHYGYKKYFNSGFILFNVDLYCRFISENPPTINAGDIVFEDQCLINLVFEERIGPLPVEFNLTADNYFFRSLNLSAPTIVHHTGLFGKPGDTIYWRHPNSNKELLSLMETHGVSHEKLWIIIMRLVLYSMGAYVPFRDSSDNINIIERFRRLRTLHLNV